MHLHFLLYPFIPLKTYRFIQMIVLLSLLQDPQSDHSHFLDLNMSKTKELISNSTKNCTKPSANFIPGREIQNVALCKYIETVFNWQLRFDVNTDIIVKNGQQRIYQLRKVNSSNVSRKIKCLFYKSFIESVIDCFSSAGTVAGVIKTKSVWTTLCRCAPK